MKVFSKTLLSFLSYSRLLVLFLFISSFNGYSQNIISIPFSNGFVGDNVANNKSSNSYYLTTLGWSNVQFVQNSPSGVFVAQGNDIIGTVLITDSSGTEVAIQGIVKWRAPSGSTITTPVFQPTTGTNVSLSTTNLGTYTITDTKYIGLTYNGATLSISPEPGDVTGNAATTGILDSFNTYLGTLSKITVSDVSVSEAAGTATVTVSLSGASANTITVNYATSNVSATAGTDYTALTGTLTFAPGQTSKTISVSITDDADLENLETFNVVLTDATNAAVIDGTGIVSISDNDGSIFVSGVINSFASCSGTVSDTQSFTVSGTSLTGDLIIAAPTGYEISLTSSSGFSSSITIPPSDGMVSSTTIYVRLKSDAINGASGDITVNSTGKIQRAITLSAATVYPVPVAGTIIGATPVCSGTNSTLLTLSGYTGEIQWQSSTDNSTFTNISGEASSTYTITNLATTTYYRAVLTSGVCTPATTSAVVVTVNPTPVIADKTATICSGSTFSVAPTNGTDVVPVGTLYTWTYTDNVNVTGEQNNIGESTTRDPFGSYIFGDLSRMDGGIRDVGQSFTATQTSNLDQIIVYFDSILSPGSATLNVYSGAGISGSLLSTQVVSINTIGENTFTLATPISTISGQVYTFVFNTTVGMEAGINVSSNAYSGGNVYIYDSGVESNEPSDLYFKTHYRSSAISGTLTNTSTTNQNVVYTVTPVSVDGCSGTPFNVTVTVTPTSVAGTITGATALCSGTNSTVLTLSGHTGTIQWQSSTDNENFTNISGQTSSTYTITNLTTTTYYRAVVTSGICASATTSAVTVTVNPLPAATVYGVDTICEGNTIILSATASSLDINYTNVKTPEEITSNSSSGWQSFTSGQTGNLTKVSFGFKNTSNTSSFIAKLNIYSGEGTTGTKLATQYVTINQPTTGFVSQDFILNSPVALTANAVYTAELVASAATNKISFFSSDASVNPSGGRSNVNSSTDYYFKTEVIASPDSNLSFQWQVNTGSGFTDVAVNGTNQFISPAIGGDYKVKVTNTTTGCYNTSTAKTVTVDAKPVANAGADEQICGTDAVSYQLVNASTTNTSTIYWYSNGTGTFNSQSIAQPTYTPSAADIIAGSVNLTIVVSGSGTCASEVGYDQMKLSFALAPKANAGLDATVCSNGSFNTVATATNGTVLWTTSGDGTFNDVTLENPIYTPGSYDISEGTVTLTMTVTGSVAGCTSESSSDAVVLTVIPTATAYAGPSEVAVCTGLSYTASNAVATNATSILWTTSGNGSFDDATQEKPIYTPSTDDIAAGLVVLTMTVSGNASCNAVSEIRLLFSPVPTANAGADDAICSDATFTTVGTASGGTIKWTTSGEGTFDDDTALNAIYTPASTDTVVTLTLTVTGTNECAALTPIVDTMVLTVSPAPTADAGATTASMCSNTTYQTLGSATNGAITWSTSGTGTFSDSTVENPIYTPSEADKLAGNVTLTIDVVGNSGSCVGNIKTDSIELTITPNPTVNAGPATAIICGGTTYQTQGTATNGAIKWTTSGSGTFNDDTIATPIYTPGVTETSGTVTLTMTVTGLNGCALDAPTDNVVLSIFTTAAVVTSTNVSCNNGADGFASVVASGGTTPYTYVWYKGITRLSQTGNELPNLLAGDYSCVVTDVNGCSVTKLFTITQPSALAVTSSQTNITTNNGSDGSANVVVTGGTAPYTYSWSPSGGNTSTAANLSAGNYTCTIVDAKGCSISEEFTIVEPGAFSASTTFTNISCNGAVNGTAAVTVTGGRLPYKYLWSNNATTSSITGLAPNTYTCTITENDGAGISITKTFIITQPLVLAASTLQTNVGINGQNTGSATVNVSGGTAPYTYSWDNSASTAATASNLAAGSYVCTITDANGCVLTKNFTITQPTIFAVNSGSTIATNILCFGSATGTATVVVAGGVAPYVYSWSPNVSTGASASNLVAGTYVCTITDANGAIATKTFVITQPSSTLSATSVSSAISCYGGTINASVTASGGVGPYTYVWSPSGGTSSNATLSAGSYICTITDVNGCSVTKDFIITQPTSALSATTNQTDIAVYGASTGSATVNVSGGTAPYSYAWSQGGTAVTISNLIAGDYTCVVTDAKGCSVTKNFTITQATSMIASVANTNVSCYGGNDGSATVSNISGGSSNYTYLWSPSGGNTPVASGLSAGTYTCYITDSNGAFITKTVSITQPNAALSAIITKVEPAINGALTGSATVAVLGGTLGYTYLWSNGATTPVATGLQAGTYSCTITDAKGCSIIKSIVLSQPTALVVNTAKTDVSCNGGTNGTAGVSASGGVLPYTYVWSPSIGLGATLNGLTSGTYTCTITDANGASVQKTINITEPTALSTSVSQLNVGCNGIASGSATVTVTGGVLPYTYSWYPSGGITQTASNLVAGNYSCVVTDANGCTVTRNITISQASILSASTSKVDVKCNGNNTGSATVSVTGGNPSYSYLWTNGDTTATASNLTAGSYSCTITDANGCSLVKNFTITEPSVLSATVSQTNVICFGQATGSAAVTVSGGVSPYTYSWSPSGGNFASANNLVAGTYTCTITDTNDCILVKTFTISESEQIPTPISNAGPNTDSICAGLTYQTNGTASGGVISWTSNGSGIFDNPTSVNAIYTPSAADRATGTVVLTMTVTPPGNCNIPTASDRVVVTIYPVSAGGIIAGTSTVCTGTNSTTLRLSEYTGSIQWQSSTDNSTFVAIPSANAATYVASNLTTTTYYRAVVTSGVCSSSESSVATITVSPSSVAGVISGETSVCSGTNSTVLSLAGNTGAIQWQSSTDNVTFNTIVGATSATYTATNLTTTKYYRVAVSNSVCSVVYSASAIIAVNPIPVADAGPATTIICGGFPFTATANAQNGSVTWSIVSGTGTFTDATIANATYTPSIADIANGSVTLRMTVTGSLLGCGANSASDTIVININSPAAPIANATQNICYAGSPKVTNLKTTLGTGVKWYLNSIGGSALDPNTNLVSGTTYYGTQTVSGCESIARTAVYVNLTCALTAVTDNFTPINGYTGGITPSVLNNDLLNGAQVVPSEIILSRVTIPSGFVLNANGTVTVPPGTATGVYNLTYKICEVANPSNCSQVVTNIVVSTTTIIAQSDAFGPLNGVKGETTSSVLNNDYLNSVIVSPLEINLSAVITPSGLTLNANGTITIAPGTPSGIYELKYKIAEKLNLTNTSQTIAAITVGACLDFPINDCDGDGVTNGQELIDATDPSDACSLKFASQTVETLTVWNDADCDGDGVTNAQEVIDGTDPTDMCAFIFSNSTVSTLAVWNNSDCDGDGVKNGQEVIDATDPNDLCSLNPVHISEQTSLAWNNSDCDGDGVKNNQEILDGTNPTDLCSLNPAHISEETSLAWNNTDCDGDGVTNGQEILDGTSPTDLCLFIKENQTVTTSNSWNNSDCDGDGVTNHKEILDGTDSLDLCSFVLSHQTVLSNQIWNNSDCDGDGVINARELADKTDPLEPCSLVVTNQTEATSELWNNLDCDGDGVANGQEIKDNTDVNNYCSSVPANVTLPLSIQFLEDDCDGDGIINSTEIGPDPKQPSNFNGNTIPDYLEVNNSTDSKDNLKVFQSLTPNGNGENDVFVISNIDLYPKNTVTVFNRWGVIVYQEDGYGTNDRYFRGYSDGQCTMDRGVGLPAGTYFYQIRYTTNEGIQKTSTGYLFINK